MKSRSTYIEVNMGRLVNNLNIIKSKIGSSKLCCVVKANGYGHGLLECAEIFLKEGAYYLAVATPDEAIQLRNKFANANILLLGGYDEDSLELLIDSGITLTIYNYNIAKSINRIATNKRVSVKAHLKIDTGMNRLGFKWSDKNVVDDMLTINNELKMIEIEGIFSHFACADDEDRKITDKQFERFMSIVNRLTELGVNIPIKHISNSAAILKFPDYHLDMVRPGLILYGMYPSEKEHDIGLLPVMTLCSTVLSIKNLQKNETVSYGATYTSKGDEIIANLPIGYADGLTRAYQDNGFVTINGHKCDIVGRICMDQTMVKLPNESGLINVGDKAIIFGEGGRTVEEFAHSLATINYEIVCQMDRRIPRIYI